MKILTLILLAALPLAGRAQGSPEKQLPARRWELEAQACYQRFNGLSTGGDTDERQTAVFFGPLAQLSYRLNPHLSAVVGLGAAHRGWHSVPFGDTSALEPTFFELTYTARAQSTSLCAPLWLRWHLNERPAARCQVALQAGVTLLSQTATRRTLIEDWRGNTVEETELTRTRRDLPLTLGLAVEYRLSARWHLSAQGQATVSYHVSDGRHYPPTALDADRPGGGGSLGVTYGFGAQP